MGFWKDFFSDPIIIMTYKDPKDAIATAEAFRIALRGAAEAKAIGQIKEIHIHHHYDGTTTEEINYADIDPNTGKNRTKQHLLP